MLSKVCTIGSILPPLCRSMTTTAVRQARFQRASVQSGLGIGRLAGSTLRQRFLGPTSGKPFIYGTYGLAGASAVGVGMLCYYGLGMGNELGTIDRSSMWPGYVAERIRATYGYLGGGLTLTAGSALYMSRSPTIFRLVSSNSLLGMLGAMAAVVGTGMLCRSIEYESTMLKHATWALHCATVGAILAPLCLLGGPLLVRAAWYTVGVVGGLSVTAATAPSERFLNWSGPLSMGLGVVFVSTMGTWVLPPSSALGAGLMSIAIYGGLVLFAALLLYDTQRVIKSAEMHPAPGYKCRQFDPINAQLSIYMDTINIFIRIAMLLSGGSRKK